MIGATIFLVAFLVVLAGLTYMTLSAIRDAKERHRWSVIVAKQRARERGV